MQNEPLIIFSDDDDDAVVTAPLILDSAELNSLNKKAAKPLNSFPQFDLLTGSPRKDMMASKITAPLIASDSPKIFGEIDIDNGSILASIFDANCNVTGGISSAKQIPNDTSIQVSSSPLNAEPETSQPNNPKITNFDEKTEADVIDSLVPIHIRSSKQDDHEDSAPATSKFVPDSDSGE